MTTWEAFCGKTIDRFNGETPGAELEAEIMVYWHHDAKRVEGAADRTAALLKAGRVNSGWAVLGAELRKHGPERKQRAKKADTRPIGERGFTSEAEQLANMEIADRQAEERARAYVSAYACPDCHGAMLPWWRQCLLPACVNRRRAEPEPQPATASDNINL